MDKAFTKSQPMKSFFMKLGHVTPIYTISWAFCESFLLEMLTSSNPWRFSPSKVSHHMVTQANHYLLALRTIGYASTMFLVMPPYINISIHASTSTAFHDCQVMQPWITNQHLTKLPTYHTVIHDIFMSNKINLISLIVWLTKLKPTLVWVVFYAPPVHRCCSLVVEWWLWRVTDLQSWLQVGKHEHSEYN